jgi:hypothetical protein
VADEIGDADAELYVDADRNRRIDEKDRIPGRDGTWSLPIKVALVQGESTTYANSAIVIRRGQTGIIWTCATAGYREGQALIDGRECLCRRIDGNVNGRYADAEDLLWIDRNHDGRWDPANEQFRMAPVLQLGGRRYVVRADEAGDSLTIEPLRGAGAVRLRLDEIGRSLRLVELSGMFVSRDGAAVAVAAEQVESTVPAGEYRLSSLAMTLQSKDGPSPAWSYVFSSSGGIDTKGWKQVRDGETVEFDPIGALEFRAGIDEKTCRPGDDLAVQPRLYTGGGLLINTCFRGSPASPALSDGPNAEVSLRDEFDRPLFVGHSGFA